MCYSRIFQFFGQNLHTNLQEIVQTSLGSDGINVLNGQGLQFTISGLFCNTHMNWHYREDSWPHISDSGSADIGVSGVSVVVNIHGFQSNQRPQVTVLSDGVNIGDLSIHLHGGASWLYQIFVNIFKGQIKDSIQKA